MFYERDKPHVPREAVEAYEDAKTDTSLGKRIGAGKGPVKLGGTNFKTHVLIKNNNSYEYKPSVISALFCSLFLIIGIGLVLFGFLFPVLTKDSSAGVKFGLLIMGFIFAGASAFLFHYIYKPIKFDKVSARYTKGYFNSLIFKEGVSIKFADIKALQIIGETIEDQDSHYESFELNLVLNDNSRTNVVDHGNLKSIIADARELSEILKVPIWHAETV